MQILLEDDDLLVINKPAGKITNQAESVRTKALQTWFAENYEPTDDWQGMVPPDFDDRYGSPEEIYHERKGMVHRLDKNTSGVLVFAKNPGALVMLLTQFRQRLVEKTYLTLGHGKVQVEADTVSLPIGRDPKNRLRFTVRSDGREATTEYEVIKFYPHIFPKKVKSNFPERIKKVKNFTKKSSLYQGFSMVEVKPKTGRTHQIRVHMKELGHPVVGDSTYNSKTRNQLDRVWCPRQFLHAWKLKFVHPRSEQSLLIKAPMQRDLRQASLVLDPT